MSTTSECYLESAYPTNFHKHDEYGLTKREYFAGLAMQGIVSVKDAHQQPIKELAKFSVQFADALLEALEE